jgi:hypothetical protein
VANTYKAISTATVGSGGAANIEFTSIPGSYTDLIVFYSLRSNRNSTIDQIKFEFNGVTTSLSSLTLYSDGSGRSSDSIASLLIGFGLPGDTATANTFGNGYIYIPNYAGSNYKSVSIDGVDENKATGVNSAQAGFSAGLWSNTSGITNIKMLLNNGTLFKQHSTATLYGIKNS